MKKKRLLVAVDLLKGVTMMKYLTIVSVLVIVSGCTTLRTVELEPDELHQQISAGKITHVGDRIQVVTSDGMRHEFTVEAVTESRIMGRKTILTGDRTEYQDIDIPIKDIVTLKIRVEDEKKSLALVGGSIAAVALLIYIGISSIDNMSIGP
jgi:hypothetical protein